MSAVPLRRRIAARFKSADSPTVDLLAVLPIPVVVLDPGDRVTVANAAAENFFNASQASLRERGWVAAMARDSRLIALIAEARAIGGGYAAYDTEIAFAGGRMVRADVFVTPLPDAAGWIIVSFQTRSVAMMVDRQLTSQGAARSAIGVAAMLAHEIKNPLSGIRGAAQLLAQTADADTRELTDLIRDEVDRVRTLIDSMEGFTDTRPLPKEPENIHAVLSHVRKLAEQGFARGVTIRERYDPSLPLIDGNRDALVQVFLNLVKNAAEAVAAAGESGGEIVLTTAYRHGLRVAVEGSSRRVSLPLEVCVVDTGKGAAPGVAAHMFEPFVTSKSAGGGLGLALVAKIVADHGGLIEYERASDPPRTILRVLLPVAGA